MKPATTIRISADERRVLHEEVAAYWIGDDGPGPVGSRSDVEEYRARLDEFVRLRDDIGWDDEDPRQEFDITIGPRLRAELEGWLADIRTDVEREIANMEKAKAGDREYWYPGIDTVDGQVAKYQQSIRRYQTINARVSAVLDRVKLAELPARERLIDPPLTDDELRAAAARIDARRGAEMGVDWCTNCGGFPGPGESIDNEECETCRRRAATFDAGGRRIAAAALGAALDLARETHTRAEVETLVAYALEQGEGALRDGHPFTEAEALNGRSDAEIAALDREYAAEEAVRQAEPDTGARAHAQEAQPA